MYIYIYIYIHTHTYTWAHAGIPKAQVSEATSVNLYLIPYMHNAYVHHIHTYVRTYMHTRIHNEQVLVSDRGNNCVFVLDSTFKVSASKLAHMSTAFYFLCVA